MKTSPSPKKKQQVLQAAEHLNKLLGAVLESLCWLFGGGCSNTPKFFQTIQTSSVLLKAAPTSYLPFCEEVVS